MKLTKSVLKKFTTLWCGVNLWLISFFCFVFSQEVGVGVGIGLTPDVFITSSETYKVSEDKMIDKIINYFLQLEKLESNTENSEVQNSTLNYIVSNDTEKVFKEIKKQVSGFGRMEIIRLMLIYEKTKNRNISIKQIVELRNKGKKLKDICAKFEIDYVNEIWLPSKKVYNEILNMKRN